MDGCSCLKGIAMGVTVGAITYAVSSCSCRSKKKMKKNTGKAIKAIGSVVDGISYMMH